VNKSLG